MSTTGLKWYRHKKDVIYSRYDKPLYKQTIHTILKTVSHKAALHDKKQLIVITMKIIVIIYVFGSQCFLLMKCCQKLTQVRNKNQLKITAATDLKFQYYRLIKWSNVGLLVTNVSSFLLHLLL